MLARTDYITIIDNIEYEVDSIINRKNSKNGLMYLVKWKGYEKGEATWEPITNLLHCIDSVKLYEKKLRERTQSIEHVQLNLADHDQNAESRKKKKRVFKDHLIFNRSNLSIKNEAKNELSKKKLISKCKKRTISNDDINRSKVNEDDDQQEGEQFCIPISQQSAQQQQQMAADKKNEEEADLFEVQSDKQNVNQVRSQPVQGQPSNEEPQPFCASLGLSELSLQQDYKLTLQNLNPHLLQAGHKREKKIQRVDIPLSSLHILQQNDPILYSPATAISKLIKASQIQLAQLTQAHQVVGYVSVKILQMANADLYLDYVEGLRD